MHAYNTPPQRAVAHMLLHIVPDRDALTACVDDAKTYAVIAPNMAKQIVALQAALEQMSADFPGSFEGYKLSVVQHQMLRSAKKKWHIGGSATGLRMHVTNGKFTHWRAD